MYNLMLSEVTLEFSQDGDGDQPYGAMQELEVVVTHSGAGPYFVIKTDRWAMDHQNEIRDLLAEVGGQVFPLFETINEREKHEC